MDSLYIYKCEYEYKRGMDIIHESSYVLGISKENVISFLEEYLKTHLLYKDIIPYIPLNGITGEVIYSLTINEMERIQKRKELSMERNKTHLFPDKQKLEEYHRQKDELKPKPFVSSIKDRILNKYTN